MTEELVEIVTKAARFALPSNTEDYHIRTLIRFLISSGVIKSKYCK